MRNIHYGTPGWLSTQLTEEYQITIDACASPGNAVCPRYWDEKADGLRQSWAGERPFWNPPFDDVSAWVHKACNEAKDNGVTSVGLVPFRKDQYWFQLALENAQLRLLQGGLLYFPGFDEQKGQAAKIDCVIFVFGPDYPGGSVGPLITPPWKPDTAKYQASGVRLYTAGNNKPEGALVVRHYASLVPYIDAFALGAFNFLVILGQPGLAKSTLFRSRLPKTACWIRGNGSPFVAYINICKSINEPIVMDDVEALLRKPGGIELLRQLGESEGVKTLTWESDASLLKKENVPTAFTTTSKLCFIANDWARLNARLMALEDRAIVVSFEPDAVEVHEQVGREGWFADKEIYDFIGSSVGIIARPSMRFYTKAQELKDAKQKTGSASLDWQCYLLKQWLKDQRLIRVAWLLADDTFSNNKERAKAFVERGWGSRSTFYAKMRELHGHQRSARVVPESNRVGPVQAVEVTDEGPEGDDGHQRPVRAVRKSKRVGPVKAEEVKDDESPNAGGTVEVQETHGDEK
jgi:site-specific DNA-methyltransferase (adenine-specific)